MAHATADAVEQLGVERSRQAMEQAQLILVLWDGSVSEQFGSIGGSVTLDTMGVYDLLARHNTVLWHWKTQDPTVRREALTAQVYLTSANGLAETGEILNIDGDEAAYIHENYPFFSSMVITGGSYQGVDEDVQTVGTLNTLICRTDLDETFVYNFVKTIMESTDTLSSVYPLCGNFNLENTLEGAVIPIHPGAEKYYKEAGIL